MIDASRLHQIKSRFREIEALMAEGGSSETMVSLGREYAEIRPVSMAIEAYDSVRSEVVDMEELLADPDIDTEMRELAESELPDLKTKLQDMEHALRLALLPKDTADSKNAIVEIRAGTGGDEAALFAGDLLRMYLRFAELEGWKTEILNAAETDLGGYKEVVLKVSGNNVFSKLKFESGGHRVQRVPETETGGRIHTSSATVAVLPEADEVDVNIDHGDLRVDTYRAQGAGGQHVNTTDSAVRITHIPTGVVAQCQDEKSQHKNRAKAMTMLRSKIYQEERRRIDEERAADRKDQVGSGDRSDRIRTYNFPQNRISDHRINLTMYNLDRILIGEALGEILNALQADNHARRLASVTGY